MSKPNISETAVIVLSGLTPEEKAKVVAECKKMCETRGIELILPEHLNPNPND